MQFPRFSASVFFVLMLLLGCERRLCGCAFPSSPLVGEWKLTRVTYGLTQKVATAAEVGYTETLSFDGSIESGTFRQTRNGIPVQVSGYSLSFPNGGSTNGVIYYKADSIQQSFRLNDNSLYLSERVALAATINDGSTYEYNR